MKFLKALTLFAAAFTLFTACKKQGQATLVMATNAEFEPYEYREKGQIVGLDIDIMQAICKKLNRTLKIEDMAFDSVIPSVNAGKADVGASGITVTEERKKNIDFTNTYVSACQVIIVLPGSPIADKDGLKGKTLGVQQGTTGDQMCTELEKTAGSKVQRFSKGSEAVLALIQKKIDAVVIDNEPAKAYLKKNAGKIVVLDKPLSEEYYAFAIKKGNKELVDQINNALAELEKPGELDAIKAKYLAK